MPALQFRLWRGERRLVPFCEGRRLSLHSLCNRLSYRWVTRVHDNSVSSELMHNFDFAVEMLDQGRTGLDPIAAVVISDIAEFMDGGAVDVSAKNAVHPIAFRVFNHRRLELSDKANRIFDPLFDVGAE